MVVGGNGVKSQKSNACYRRENSHLERGFKCYYELQRALRHNIREDIPRILKRLDKFYPWIFQEKNFDSYLRFN